MTCWGDDSRRQATPPAAVDGRAGTAPAIVTGLHHSCAIQAPQGTATQVFSPAGPGEGTLDVDLGGDLPVPIFARVAVEDFGGCAPGSGGMYAGFFGVTPLSEGGLFRCPMSLAYASDHGEIYVADAETLLGFGTGRIVGLEPDSSGVWQQLLFIDAAALGIPPRTRRDPSSWNSSPATRSSVPVAAPKAPPLAALASPGAALACPPLTVDTSPLALLL